MTDLVQIVAAYHDRGFAWLPIAHRQKGPRMSGWQNFRGTRGDIPKYFGNGPMNVAIILGPPSHGLADLDLDVQEAIDAAAYLAPVTGAIFGRPGKRNSHRLYFLKAASLPQQAVLAFDDPFLDKTNSRARLVELRIGVSAGACTVFPGSVHPNGEKINWEIEGEPAPIAGGELIAAASHIASAALLARYWPPTGKRHRLAQVIGGVLARCGWPLANIKCFTEACSVAAADPERGDRIKTAIDAAEAHILGKKSFGLPELTKLINDAVAKQIAEWLKLPPTPTSRSRTGKTKACTPLAISQYLRSDLPGLVKLDQFALTIILCEPIPGTDATGFQPRRWQDTDTTSLIMHLNSIGFRKVGFDILDRVVALEAQRHGFHPVRDYLASLKWDNVDRLSTWLIDYAGADVEDIHEPRDTRRYVEAVSRATLISACARVMSPGCKADTMLILQGPQGSLKSTLLATLAVKDDWFSDSFPTDLANKDAKLHLRGRWIIELSEVSQFRRNELETVKAFLSSRIDRYRPPYGRAEIDVPRQSILLGTTNDDVFLHDATGNRRSWSVTIGHIDIEAFRRDRDQLLAEAYSAFQSGEQWHLSPEIEAIAARQQEDRLERDPWFDIVAEHVVKLPGPFTTRRIMEQLLEISSADRTRAHEMRIANVFRLLGLKRGRRQLNGIRCYVFEKEA